MTTRDVTIAMTDGVTLAAPLYRPDTAQPRPCLLEAPPYRKDDVTASYPPEYERSREEFGCAVCRLDLRGTTDDRYTDDRYTDDVHYMGGVRRLRDIVDHPTYLVALNARRAG